MGMEAANTPVMTQILALYVVVIRSMPCIQMAEPALVSTSLHLLFFPVPGGICACTGVCVCVCACTCAAVPHRPVAPLLREVFDYGHILQREKHCCLLLSRHLLTAYPFVTPT